MPKRKAEQLESSNPPRRSSRQSAKSEPNPPAEKEPEEETVKQVKKTGNATEKSKNAKTAKEVKEELETESKVEAPASAFKTKSDIESKAKDTVTSAPEQNGSSSRQYWLMKAEPETRLEGGVDVKFSIDDLAAKTEPEPWDGIRAYPARNNLRAMKKGDLTFFYHSNCKVPGIIGVMEIVQEHEPDLSAHDPKAPYYDPKDDPKNPKWSIVKVEFRRKFKELISLKELREFQTEGPLANMQMLKQSRLSVSKVSPEEWEFLMSVVEKREGAK